MFSISWHKVGAGVLLAGALGTGGTIAADRAIDPYADKGDHYELPRTSDIPQGEHLEIAKDSPAVTLKYWNDEGSLTITPQVPGDPNVLGAATKQTFSTPSRPLLSKQMQFKSGDTTAFVEPSATSSQFEIDFTLDAKPATNVFTYKIDGAEDLDFFYQPPLTKEEIAGGAERPDNVIGSYAIYSKNKTNHVAGQTNYGAGKVAQVLRPKVVDANGITEWADLEYQNGILAVTVSQTFLDTAAYPVIVDPTFGYTSQGASDALACGSVGDGGEGMRGVGITGTLTDVNAYLKVNNAGANTIYKLALYSEVSSKPGAVLISSATFSVPLTTYALYTKTLSQAMIGANYWAVGTCAYDGHAGRMAFDSGGTAGSGADSGLGGAWTTDSNRYSVYATYTASVAVSPDGTTFETTDD